jgi:sterol O-acyltransferase
MAPPLRLYLLTIKYRQNAASADSPFHGFFTLFWLGIAIFMIQIAAKNWQAHGHILGTNEILGIMLHRDLMVLGFSDGVLFAATGFGWVLQKLILRGYLSWDSTGWIIQNVLRRAPQALYRC